LWILYSVTEDVNVLKIAHIIATFMRLLWSGARRFCAVRAAQECTRMQYYVLKP
jgi:hypothetical protein